MAKTVRTAPFLTTDKEPFTLTFEKAGILETNVIKLTTKKYQDEFIKRIQDRTRGFATPGQRAALLEECWYEENVWLETMSKEYDDVMADIELYNSIQKP